MGGWCHKSIACPTLRSCRDCISCKECKGYRSCSGRTICRSFIGCRSCRSCRGCKSCKGSRRCIGCTSCNSCRAVKTLKASEIVVAEWDTMSEGGPFGLGAWHLYGMATFAKSGRKLLYMVGGLVTTPSSPRNRWVGPPPPPMGSLLPCG